MAAWGSFMWIYKWAQQNPLLPRALGLDAKSSAANFLDGLQAGTRHDTHTTQPHTHHRIHRATRDTQDTHYTIARATRHSRLIGNDGTQVWV